MNNIDAAMRDGQIPPYLPEQLPALVTLHETKTLTECRQVIANAVLSAEAIVNTNRLSSEDSSKEQEESQNQEKEEEEEERKEQPSNPLDDTFQQALTLVEQKNHPKVILIMLFS